MKKKVLIFAQVLARSILNIIVYVFHYQLIKAFYIMQQFPFPDESLERIIFDKIFDKDDKVTISFQPTESTRVCVFVPRGNDPLFKVDRVRDDVLQHFEE